MKAIDLTIEQLDWFIHNFPTTKNQEVADHLGVSISTVKKIARELGIGKSNCSPRE